MAEQQRCKDCKWWGTEHEDAYCFRTCQRVKCDRNEYSGGYYYSAKSESIFDEPAVAVDGGDYFAALRTQADFGCVLFESKEEA